MYELLKKLCIERGTNITSLCEQVTGNRGNLATWKKGYMRSDYLKKVAEILDVTTDYLLGEVKQVSQVNSNNNNSQIVTGNNINNDNSSVCSNPINDKEVWEIYEQLSVKDKLEVKLDIINRGNK